MTSLSAGDCLSNTCPVPNGFLSSPPSLDGNVFMLAAFAVLVPLNLWLGIKYKAPLYALLLIVGLLLEVMGYVGRILLRSDLASKAYFMIFLFGTIVGPTFISGAIYSALPHIMTIYGNDLSVTLRPIYVSVFFLGFDLFTLAFQTVGAVFVVEGTSTIQRQQGSNILLVGLGLQAASVLLFFGIYWWFMAKRVRYRHLLDPHYADIFLSSMFKTFLLFLQLSAILILVRTAIRLYQVASGFDSDFSQSNIFTLVLDGALVLLACVLLTLFPPAVSFGSAVWESTSPHGGDTSNRYRQHMPLQPRSPLYHDNLYSPPPFPPEPIAKPQASPNYPIGLAKTSPTYSAASTTPGDPDRTSPKWNKRQPAAIRVEGQVPPPYDRPRSYQRIPYQPPTPPAASAASMSTRRMSVLTESGSEGTSVSGALSGRPRRMTRPQQGENLVQHDAIW